MLSLAGDERLTAVSVIDERVAGFMALGMAKATGRPVVVTCTSGTAAANLAPAVHEAWQARVPLIVLTADRPPELRDVGAGQAIDQIGLYGSAAKWFVELGNGEPGPGVERPRALDRLPRLGHRRRRAPGAGAREPAAARAAGPGARGAGRGATGRAAADGAPWTEVREHSQAPDGDDVQALAARMAETPRGVDRLRGGGRRGRRRQVARLAEQAGWPVLADALSGVRCGQHDLSHVVAHYDVLLRDQGFAAGHAPDLVLRVGDTPDLEAAAGVAGRRPSRWCSTPTAPGTSPPAQAEPDAARRARRPTCDALATALEMRGDAGGDWVPLLARGRRAGARRAGRRRPTRSSPRCTPRWRTSCPRGRRSG